MALPNHLPFPEVVDTTMLKDFRTCPRKFYLARMLGLQPNFQSIHLLAGKTYASGMETFRLYYYSGYSLTLSRNAAIVAMIREWGEEDPREDEKKNLWNMILAFLATIENWNPAEDYIKPYMQDGKPTVEFNFVLPFPGSEHPITGHPLLYTGRFDTLAVYRESQLMIEDDKTTSTLGAQWVNSWDMNSQVTAYMWGAKSFGLDVLGAVIRGCSILKNSFGFAESLQYRSQWEIDRWVEQTNRDLKRMQRCWEDNYWDYDLGDACNAYGGCSYKKLCTKQDPSKWIEPEFKVEFWKPLEITGAVIEEIK